MHRSHPLQFFLLLSVLLITTSNFAAPQELHHFSTPAQQIAFENLTHNLRCLVCQNQSLADSDAGLAKDLRTEIYQLIIQGKNQTQIQRYLTERYGNFILFKPPLNTSTYLLWFGPFLLLLLAFTILFYFIRARRVA